MDVRYMPPAGRAVSVGPFTPDRASGFLLFSPDAFCSGRHRYALRYLADLGIRLKGVVRLRPTGEQVAKLYEKNRRGRAVEPADVLVDRLFDAGPSLACWLVSDRLHTPSLVDTLRALKGPSDPSGCLPGHLRHLLGAENRLMNGVHSSDSTDEAAEEVNALGITNFLTPAEADTANVDLGEETVGAYPFGALAVACVVRRRVLRTALADSLPEVWDLQQQAEALAGRRIKPLGVLTALGALWDRQHAAVEAADMPDSRTVARGLAQVAEACSARFDADLLAAAVAPYSIAPTGWEDLVLRCQESTGALPGWHAQV